jgi:hypothetical protein
MGRSHQKRETRDFVFGNTFLVAAGKRRDGVRRRLIAEV